VFNDVFMSAGPLSNLQGQGGDLKLLEQTSANPNAKSSSSGSISASNQVALSIGAARKLA
jgi:hypothetical protein